MSHSLPIDIKKIPIDLWDRKEYLLSEALPGVLARSTEYIQNHYKSREQLEAGCCFMEDDLLDAPSGEVLSLLRVGFFPWIEAQHELGVALDQALLGFHRASYDHQRRSLELILVGTWFVSGQTTHEEARKWINSRDQTPFFSKTLDGLSKEDLYVELEAQTDWASDVKKFYRHLCDILHVRGIRNGINALKPNQCTFNGLPVPVYSERTLEKVLDSLIATIGYIALLIAMSNPVLLFGFPVEQKYGINGPFGFFEEEQAERLRTLIPEKYRNSLVALAEEGPCPTGFRDHFLSLPDLTAQQRQAQYEDFIKMTGPNKKTTTEGSA